MGSTQSTQYEMPNTAYESVQNRATPSKHNTGVNVTTQQKLRIRSRFPANVATEASYCNSPLDHSNSAKQHDELKCKEIETFDKHIDPSQLPSNDNVTHVTWNQPVQESNRKTVIKSIVKPPNKLNDLDDFIRNWNVWKEQLRSFLIIMNENKKNDHEWGIIFLHFMGSFGQQILVDLIFDEEDDKKNYAILLRKYDIFYNFNTAVKSKSESTVGYIAKLKDQIVQNIRNVDNTLKEKIRKEIETFCKERFIALAKSKLSNFKFETTFNSLTLAEIAFLWQMCEESTFDHSKSCPYCGIFHQEGKCKAFGKECNKCKRRNHFAKYCPGFMYVINCSFCGGNHEGKRCPSYGEICSKCGKYNHFSWKCSKTTLLKNCRYCDMSHLMDRRACPAINSLCCICKQRGHYATKCNILQKNLNTD